MLIRNGKVVSPIPQSMKDVIKTELLKIAAEKGEEYMELVLAAAKLDEVILVFKHLSSVNPETARFSQVASGNLAEVMGWGHDMHDQITGTDVSADEIYGHVNRITILSHEAAGKELGVDPAEFMKLNPFPEGVMELISKLEDVHTHGHTRKQRGKGLH